MVIFFQGSENLSNLHCFQSDLFQVRFHLVEFVTTEMVNETVVTGSRNTGFLPV
jgi:hypothetical protein